MTDSIKLIFLISCALGLSSCVMKKPDPFEEEFNLRRASIDEQCYKKLVEKVYETGAEMADKCSKPQYYALKREIYGTASEQRQTELLEQQLDAIERNNLIQIYNTPIPRPSVTNCRVTPYSNNIRCNSF